MHLVAAPAVLLILGKANALFGFGARQSDVTEARATAMALIRENAAGDDFVPPACGVGRRDAAKFIAARASGKLACGDSSSSSMVSWEMVNDDFCDCQDGSDEPGTSACSNGECGLVGVVGGYYCCCSCAVACTVCRAWPRIYAPAMSGLSS